MNPDYLQKIKHVDVPPFLFTRIQQKIERNKRERMPESQTLILALSFALILIFNVLVITKYTSQTNDAAVFAESIHLTSDNFIYK